MSLETRLKKLEAQKPASPTYEDRLLDLLNGKQPGDDPALEARLREMLEAEAAASITATPMEELP